MKTTTIPKCPDCGAPELHHQADRRFKCGRCGSMALIGSDGDGDAVRLFDYAAAGKRRPKRPLKSPRQKGIR